MVGVAWRGSHYLWLTNKFTPQSQSSDKGESVADCKDSS